MFQVLYKVYSNKKKNPRFPFKGRRGGVIIKEIPSVTSLWRILSESNRQGNFPVYQWQSSHRPVQRNVRQN